MAHWLLLGFVVGLLLLVGLIIMLCFKPKLAVNALKKGDTQDYELEAVRRLKMRFKGNAFEKALPWVVSILGIGVGVILLFSILKTTQSNITSNSTNFQPLINQLPYMGIAMGIAIALFGIWMVIRGIREDSV